MARSLGKGTERILLVDDAAMVTGAGQAMLEELGCHWFVAQSGEQALDIVRHDGRAIDLIMLGLGGGKSFDVIRDIQPSIPVILRSGYALNDKAGAVMERDVTDTFKNHSTYTNCPNTSVRFWMERKTAINRWFEKLSQQAVQQVREALAIIGLEIHLEVPEFRVGQDVFLHRR